MKCTKCGSDAVMKDGDWLTCLNCGNVMFDTRRPEETAAEISPTKLLEQMEAAAAQEEAPTGNYGPYTVPADSYFMMGDNRNHSEDSRFWQNKFVKKNKIVGKVEFRYYPKFSTID